MSGQLEIQLEDGHTLSGKENVNDIASRIDVIWFDKNDRPVALFEIESTTSIYSGLLRINDLRLTYNLEKDSCHIVADIGRKTHFDDQIRRPTFVDLKDVCTFVSYDEVAYRYQDEVVRKKPAF